MTQTSLNEKYRLSEKVSIVSVKDLPPEMRAKFSWEDGDCALNLDQSRRRTQIVSKSASMLLLSFLQPAKLLDAVISTSKLSKLNPESMLVEAWPFLESMIQAGVLQADSEPSSQKQSPLQIGDIVSSYEIVEIRQLLEDFVVFRAIDVQQNSVALKVCSLHDAIALSIFRREVLIGTMLGGFPGPRVITTLVWQNKLVMVSEWIEGCSVNSLPFNKPPWDDMNHRVAICGAILEAYIALQVKGILHGDVHPGNIIVDHSRVRLLDFGAAIIRGEVSQVPRVGVAPFFEPEQARAMLEKTSSPPLTAAGEQYAIATVLYYVLSGGFYYSEFSAERKLMLQQISDGHFLDAPEFVGRLSGAPATVVTALIKAMQSKVEERFASLYELHAAFTSHQPPRRVTNSSEELQPAELVEKAVNYFLSHSDQIWTSVFSKSPFSSVNLGGAGVAYALLELARITGNPRLLEAGDLYAEHSLTLSKDDAAFYNPTLPITEAEVGRFSLYHTATGVACVRAQIAASRGDLLTCQNSVDEFNRCCGGTCQSLDLTLGYAGLLLGSALLIETLRDIPMDRAESLRIAGTKLIDKIWSDSRFRTDQYLRQVKYLGIAHGVAGIMYATLRFCHVTGDPFPQDMMLRLKKLADLGIKTLGARVWPMQYNQDKIVGSWCNGTAGFVQLWCEAYDVFADKYFLDLAIEAAKAVNIEEGASITSLCCGAAGQGFAFLRLFGATGDDRWLAAAKRCVSGTLHPEKYFLDGEHSLYKGGIGLLLLAGGILRPASARMPLFD
jgi:serine/threonine protein kinase